MALATYKDLCIDAVDAPAQTRFWAGVLHLEPHLQANGDGELRTPEGDVVIWVNGVPEPTTAKSRVHIDVNAESLQQVLDLGATVVGEYERWTTLRDPDGQELCVFVRDHPVEQRIYELGWDCPEGADVCRARAEWWQAVLGGAVHDHEDGYSWLQDIPGAPFEAIDFVGVPEPKTTKNRVHLDVVADDLDALLAHGSTVITPASAAARWTVLADPDGNELCVFPGPARG